MPEVYKPSELNRLSSTQESMNDLKKGNQTIRDMNELVVNGIKLLETLGVWKRQQGEQTAGVAQKIEAGVDKRMSEVQSNMQRANPEAYVKPELKVKYQEATRDLLEKLHNLQESEPEMTLKQAVDKIKELNTAGILDAQLEAWIRRFVILT